MSRNSDTDRWRPMGWATFAGGCFVVLFWTFYFSGAIDLGQQDEIVSAFESAFPVADLLFAVVLFAASVTLLRRRRHGPYYLVAAGAMSLYLGIIDATFYASQGGYYPITTDGIVGLVVNALCIVGGGLALWCGSKFWVGAPVLASRQIVDVGRQAKHAARFDNKTQGPESERFDRDWNRRIAFKDQEDASVLAVIGA